MVEIKIQKRKTHDKYFVYYVNLPKSILKKARWLKREKIAEAEVDLIGNVVIKPE